MVRNACQMTGSRFLKAQIAYCNQTLAPSESSDIETQRQEEILRFSSAITQAVQNFLGSSITSMTICEYILVRDHLSALFKKRPVAH